MTEVEVPAQFDLSEVGLRIKDPYLKLSEFTDICWMLGQAHMALRFAIGDALIQGEALYGEAAFAAFDALQLSPEGMQEYRRVASRIPISRRRRGLSWSHHRAVASLEPPEQKEWLKRAETEGLSHHALREELRNGAEPKAYTTCRCCGRTL